MRNKILFFAGFIFTAVASPCQTTIKVTERLENGIANAGEAKYYFYETEKGKKVKHGLFKYDLRQMVEYYKFYQSISGKYSHGFKDGVWKYQTTLKDFRVPEKKDKVTGKIELYANYNAGVPDGKWQYIYSIKTRKIEEFINGRPRFADFSNPEIINAHFSFKNGILVDTFKINYKNSTNIIGTFDKNGFYHGSWHIKSQNTEVLKEYEHGILKKSISRKNENEHNSTQYVLSDSINQYFKEYSRVKTSNASQTKELTFTVDTINIHQKPELLIYKILKEQIFENKYMLPKYIDGEKLSFKEIKGGYETHIINQVSASQQTKLDEINKLANDLIKINQKATSLCKERGTTNAASNMLKSMDMYAGLAKRFRCMANELVLHMSMEIGIKKSYSKCKGEMKLIQGLPSFKTEDEALDYFIEFLKEKKEIAENQYNLIEK